MESATVCTVSTNRDAGSEPIVRSSSAQVRAPRKRKPSAVQEALPFRAWGGARPGAGRKRTAERKQVPHRKRTKHAARYPVQITSRVIAGLPSLRRADESRALRDLMVRLSRPEFRVAHYSIQSNHLHLIVEAFDRHTLTEGLRGLFARAARVLNGIWKRRGAVFSERFHERELRTPLEVRNSLVYVLFNARKHGDRARGPDPLSSGRCSTAGGAPTRTMRVRELARTPWGLVA